VIALPVREDGNLIVLAFRTDGAVRNWAQRERLALALKERFAQFPSLCAENDAPPTVTPCASRHKRRANLWMTMVSTSVGERFRNGLCVVSIDDVPNAIFSHYVHGNDHWLPTPVLFRASERYAQTRHRGTTQCPLYFSDRILDADLLKRLGIGRFWKTMQAALQGFTIVLRSFIRIS